MKKNEVISQVKSHSKVIASVILGYGVGQIMGNVLKDYKPDAKGLKKILIKLGAAALTGMVIKEVCKFAEGEIDEVFDAVEAATCEGDDEDEDPDSNAEDDEERLYTADEESLKEVLTKMQDHIDKYGYVTLFNLHKYLDIRDKSNRSNWIGWTSLDGFRIRKSNIGSYFVLERPTAIELVRGEK